MLLRIRKDYGGEDKMKKYRTGDWSNNLCEIWFYDDEYDDEEYFGDVRTEDAGKIVKLLNEGEQLRHDANVLIQANKDYRIENEQLKQEVENLKDVNVRCCNDYSHYRRENEQLKQTMKEVSELLSDEVDLFSDKATEHDINAYMELKQLDNKDAYCMAKATKKAIKMLKGDV